MLTAIGDVLRECYNKGWLTSRDGNVSLRKSLDGNISKHMYLTPKGVRKYNIHPEDIVKIDLSKGPQIIDGASTEFMMHYKLQIDAKSSRSVVHAHPTHVVAAMFAGWDLQEISKMFPEISRYTKVGPTVKFHSAGSEELAHNTNLCLRGDKESGPLIYDIVGQSNHGVCAVGKNPWDAYEHIERLNHICEIVLVSGVKP